MANINDRETQTKFPARKPLGELLIEAGLISAIQLELALQDQEEEKLKVGEILAMRGWIKQETADFFADRWFNLLQDPQKQPLAYYFKEAHLLSEVQIEHLIQEQATRTNKVRFHRLAVEKGYLRQITVDFFLAHIFNIYGSGLFSFAQPYEVLRDYTKGKKVFTRLELTNAPLIGISLKGVQLDGSNLRGADLTNGNLTNSSLIQVNLTLATLVKTVLTEVNLERACMVKASLRQAHLEKANFYKANLQEADLTGAYLYQTSLAGANLQGAKLPQEYSYDVYYDRDTSFDSSFNPQQMGWKLI
jgi:uncharacterized protein YjbI with pentapeptide repeats